MTEGEIMRCRGDENPEGFGFWKEAAQMASRQETD
jgi:hypothetical protein